MNRSSIKRVKSISKEASLLILISRNDQLKNSLLDKDSIKLLEQKFAKNQIFVSLTLKGRHVFVSKTIKEQEAYIGKERFRVVGSKTCQKANQNKIQNIGILNLSEIIGADVLAAEGMALANYQFLKYRKNAKAEYNTLSNIQLEAGSVDKKTTDGLQNLIDGVYYSRTLINEPLNYLTAPQIAKEIKTLGKIAGFKTTVFDKARIKKEKMAGLLAVNLGSIDPPTFSILEWKPKKAKNSKPIVLVGKGVVFDTGGLSLKPTSNSMDFMKCDMGGAAAVIGAMYTLAKNKVDYHVIALVPATDNRPGLNAYVPGDVIKMRDGLTVEVLNTDAEGRMIMADALSWAKNYKPELVIDLATLTGATVRAIGPCAIAMMSKADRKTTQKLIDSGFNTYERLVEFPLWEEYGDMVKSDIADIKNVGGPLSGSITAGKFLEHFTDYPWMHLDIAATAWNFKDDAYRLKNGVGSGVRLLVDFVSSY